MTNQPPGSPAPGQLLFTPGPRLGWTFRSHRDLIGPYREPPPDPAAIGRDAAGQLAAAQRSWERARTWVLRPSLMAAIALAALAGCAHAFNPAAPLAATLITAIVVAVPGTGWALWRFTQLQRAKSADPQHLYDASHQAWQDRAAAWEHDQLARVAAVPEWASAPPPSGHTDVFGGTPGGWASLVTVHGASVLAVRPLVVADLTGHGITAGLTALARGAGVQVAEYLLPDELGGLLSGLTPPQFADALAEAIHAGPPGTARTDRAVDVRVLEQLAGVLAAGGLSPVRLAAAVQAALGRPVPAGLLTPGESELIQGTLFGDAYRSQIGASLVRLDAFLAGLAGSGTTATAAPVRPAWCTVLAASPAGRSARGELTGALVIQWLTAQVTALGPDSPAIIVAGADEIGGQHLERLTDACASSGVPVTVLFRHLRDDATGLIGGGATAFMRLGNHREAEQAAAFIGRQHSFVLSSFTASRGGEQALTHGTTRSWGGSETRGFSTSRGPDDGFFPGIQSRSRDYSRTWGYGTEESVTDGTNWNDAETRQRVYEYQVEPGVLQSLPGNAMLLVNRSAGTGIQPVECHPAIVTLPGVSMTPITGDLMHPTGNQDAIEAGRQDLADLATPVYRSEAAEEPPPRNWWETGDSWNQPR